MVARGFSLRWNIGLEINAILFQIVKKVKKN